MKNYEKILSDITELGKTVKSGYDIRSEQQKKFAKISYTERMTDKAIKMHKEFDIEIQNNDNKIETLTLLKSNLVHVFYQEYLQILVDTINKFANKRIGEKTKAKLNDELKQATNGYVNSVHIGDTTINIYTSISSQLDYRDITVYAKYIDGECIKFWQTDGKLQGFSLEQIDYNSYSYIDDIQVYIQERKQAQKQLQEQFEQFNTAKDEYNNRFGRATRSSQRASVQHDRLDFKE